MKQNITFDKIVVELSRVIVGATFAFSGFVKAVDPLGFTYKIQDYLITLNLTELFSLALPAAIFMVVAEFALGIFLLLGIYRKVTTHLLGLFMAFFTPLTLWIALTNPVEDCGCFGDALIISNWQTFYKNIILLAGTIFLIIKWRKISPLFSSKTAALTAILVVLYGVLFSLHNTYRLPIMDFRPYKIGANIPAQMFVDPDKADIFETVFIYSKDGVEKEFTETDYPWNDSTWTFINMESRLVKEGEKPAIEDFAIESLYQDEAGVWNIGGDITDLVLSDTTHTFLMVSYSLEKMNLRNLDRFIEIANYADDNGYPFYCLTASSSNVVGEWEAQHNTGLQFCHADERALKTMIRANPGLMLIKEGTVINKWDDSKVPSSDNLFDRDTKSGKDTEILISLILFFVPLLIIKVTDRKK
ncbi:MAG: DoxX family protein [Fermentimonas sp.]|nr:DoxX family protein [Fermentimonas sp.]